jgi:hypothetical protein
MTTPATALRFRRMLATALIGAGIGTQAAYSQPPPLEDAISYLLDNALEIKVGLSLNQPEPYTDWNSEQTDLTIPGRAVDVEVTGTNLHVRAVFTPYMSESGDLTLVAQGQVWWAEAPEAPARYVTTYRSVPLSLGQKLLFFPLGIHDDVADEVTLKLEIEVSRYVATRPSSSDASDDASDDAPPG